MFAGEVEFYEEVCPDGWGCDIRDSDVPFIFAIVQWSCVGIRSW